MSLHGTVFGWAFGDSTRSGEAGYLDELKKSALVNAAHDAAGKGVAVVPDSETFTVVGEGGTLMSVSSPQGSLVVRCTVHVVGPGAEELRGEGPING